MPLGSFGYSDEMHWLLAAQWNHLSWPQFKKLPPEEQCEIVAGYECYERMRSIEARDQIREMERQKYKPKAGSGGKGRR